MCLPPSVGRRNLTYAAYRPGSKQFETINPAEPNVGFILLHTGRRPARASLKGNDRRRDEFGMFVGVSSSAADRSSSLHPRVTNQARTSLVRHTLLLPEYSSLTNPAGLQLDPWADSSRRPGTNRPVANGVDFDSVCPPDRIRTRTPSEMSAGGCYVRFRWSRLRDCTLSSGSPASSQSISPPEYRRTFS
jgi:hypothetical protein